MCAEDVVWEGCVRGAVRRGQLCVCGSGGCVLGSGEGAVKEGKVCVGVKAVCGRGVVCVGVEGVC